MTKDALPFLIGENIRAERSARGMSLGELAELLKLSTGFVGLVERGQRGATSHVLYQLTQIFDVSMDVLFAPNANPSAMVAEADKELTLQVLRKKINSLVVGLTGRELEFIISTIKNIRTMNHSKTTHDDEEEEED